MKIQPFISQQLASLYRIHRAGFFLGLLVTGVLILLQPLVIKSAHAASQLLVSPTRVVFEGRTRSAQVTLANTGDRTGRYRISFVRKQMTDAGGLVEVKDDTPGLYADPFVRFSPREVNLQPGQSQVVRLMLRKKSDMAEGEYRSHMMFQALPDSEATSIQTLTNKSGEKLQIQLIPVVGVTIPVIVRHGKLEATASLGNLQFLPSTEPKLQPRLTLRLGREGSRSVYGDFKVTFKPEGKEPLVVARSNGVALYTPNTTRTVTFNLQAPSGVQLKKGELHVIYLKHGQDAPTGLIAEERLRLP